MTTGAMLVMIHSLARNKIRNPNIEIRNNFKVRNIKRKRKRRSVCLKHLVFLSFDIVFELRIWCFDLAINPAPPASAEEQRFFAAAAAKKLRYGNLNLSLGLVLHRHSRFPNPGSP